MAVLLKNNATSTLAANISSGATQLTVQTADAALFPAPTGSDWFPLTLIDAAGNMEIVKATARSSGTITIARAQEGTTAKAFTSGARVDLRMTAACFSQIIADLTARFGGDIQALETVLGSATGIATAAEFIAAATNKLLLADRVWEAAIPSADSVTGTISVDFAQKLNRVLTATGNITLGVTSNIKKGQSFIWEFIHSGAARTIALNSTYWTTPSGAGLTLSGAAGDRDVLAGYVLDNGKVMITAAALKV